MPDTTPPIFTVNSQSDPAVLRIHGRANYTNCSPAGTFLQKMAAKGGPQHLIIDFGECTAIDSTFMGLLAGTAMAFNKQQPPRQLTLIRLSPENLKLVKDLGLPRVLNIAEMPPEGMPAEAGFQDAGCRKADKRTILQAHENLCEADKANEEKFQDVLSFLRQK
jgi:anti-anti-sigma regulatory factor